MSLDRWGLCRESVDSGVLCNLASNHKGSHEVRLTKTEQGLMAATRDWTVPMVVRTYKRDDSGQALLKEESAALAAHGYQATMQSEDGGHVHAGRLLLTGGLSVFAGGRGVRSKGALTITFQLVPATQPAVESGGSAEPAQALESLKSLRDRELITSEEYEVKRAAILERL